MLARSNRGAHIATKAGGQIDVDKTARPFIMTVYERL